MDIKKSKEKGSATYSFSLWLVRTDVAPMEPLLQPVVARASARCGLVSALCGSYFRPMWPLLRAADALGVRFRRPLFLAPSWHTDSLTYTHPCGSCGAMALHENLAVAPIVHWPVFDLREVVRRERKSFVKRPLI